MSFKFYFTALLVTVLAPLQFSYLLLEQWQLEKHILHINPIFLLERGIEGMKDMPFHNTCVRYCFYMLVSEKDGRV